MLDQKMRMSNLKKFITFNSAPNKNTFPDLPIYVTWFRILIGLLYGTHLGVTSHYGGLGLFVGLSIVTFVPLSYIDIYLKGRAETYDKLTFTGVPNAMALLTLVWIGIWTFYHPELESNLSSALVDVAETVFGDAANLTETASEIPVPEF